MKKENRGGFREGAGRKPPPSPTTTVSFRVCEIDYINAKAKYGRELNKEVSKLITKLSK